MATFRNRVLWEAKYGIADETDNRQFAYYKDPRNRISLVDGNICDKWTRTSSCNNSKCFVYVYGTGGVLDSYLQQSRLGICLGFCIRKSQDVESSLHLRNWNGFIKKIATEISWGEIQKKVDQGMASTFHPGDEVSDTLKDGSPIAFVVAAVNHYENDEIIFVMKDSLWEEPINEKYTNYGGWPRSCLIEKVKTDLQKKLPDDLVRVIAPRKITQIIKGERFECEVKLWPPSEVEYSAVDGENVIFGIAEETDDKQFEYYKDHRNRISYYPDGYDSWKWTRTPVRDNSHCFMIVAPNGSVFVGGHWPDSQLGVVLGFCIRKTRC